MAFLSSEITFLGSLGELSAYKMRGVDKIVVRKKGGASREQIKSSPSFVLTRQNNAEFGGRAAATQWIMRMLRYQKPMADYNIAGPLNAMLRPMQLADKVNDRGQRSILLSANPGILQGFSLNRKVGFNSMLRTPLAYEISKDTCTAEIQIPQLIPGINFHVPQYPWYKIIASLGIVPDLKFTATGYMPFTSGYSTLMHNSVETPWLAVKNGGELTKLTLQCNELPPDSNFSMILAVGIAFGTVMSESDIQQVRYAGSAQVLAMA